ncbi:MAG: hypothetical protein HY812_02220 [Planctomycetes bacterium]|nr:hypothetical protein [Planctomycetota bacterium]
MAQACTFALATLLSILPLAPARAQDDLAGLVPAATRFYASVPSLSRTWEGFRSLPLYQVFQGEEVRAFLQAFGQGDDWPLAGLSQEFAGELLELPAIFDGQAAFALIDPEEDDWVLSLASSQDAARVEGFAEKLLAALRGPLPAGPESSEIAGARLLTFRGPVRDWHAATSAGRLLISPCRARLESVISGAESGGASLAEDEDFRRGSAGLVDGATSFFLYVPLRRLLDEQIAEAGEQECDALLASGCDGLQSLVACLAMSEGRARDVVRLDIDGERRGFFDLFGEGPVDPALARLAPPDALFFAASQVRTKELHHTWSEVHRVLQDGLFPSQKRPDQERSEAAKEAAFAAVVESLGQNVAFFVSAPGTSGIIPIAALAVETLRPDELQSHLATLCTAWFDNQVLTTAYRGRTIAYCKEKENDRLLPMSFSLCWCLAGGCLLVSHHTTILKEIINRLDGARDSLADDPAFRASWEALPPEARLVAYTSSKNVFLFLHSLVRSFSIFGRWEPAWAILPTAESIAPHLSFGLSGLLSDDRGLLLVTKSDGYGPTSLAMYALVARAVPYPFEEMDRVACGSVLSDIHESLTKARQERQRCPAALDVGIEGYLQYRRCPEAKRQSAGAVDFEYVVTATGIEPPETFPEDWMIVWDSEPRHNNGRMVLLGSGDIIWLPEAAFQQRLDEQTRW